MEELAWSASCWQHSTIAHGRGAIMVLLCYKAYATDGYYKGCQGILKPCRQVDSMAKDSLHSALCLSVLPWERLVPRTPRRDHFQKVTWRILYQVCLHTQSSGRISSNLAPSNTSTCLCSVPKACHKHLPFQAVTLQSSSSTLPLFQAL